MEERKWYRWKRIISKTISRIIKIIRTTKNNKIIRRINKTVTIRKRITDNKFEITVYCCAGMSRNKESNLCFVATFFVKDYRNQKKDEN